MSDKSNTAAAQSGIGFGFGFGGLLGLLVIGLKLAHVINWSWWWVLAPFWLPLAIFVSIMLLAFICLAIGSWLDGGE